jgi:integrase
MSFRTQRDLERLTLPPGKAEVFHFDETCPGLSVRIQRTGKPTYVVWFTAPGGKRKRLTIGAVAGTKLQDARDQTTAWIRAARDGRDPGMERRAARTAAAEALTVGDLITAYLKKHAERHQRPRTLIETKRALERHWKPLHELTAAAVTRAEVSARLLELADTSGTVGANRARANLSAAFAWGMRAGLVDHNPVIGTVKGEEVSGERVLTPDELRAIWQATEDLNGYDAIVRVLMLTLQRKSEVGGLARAELDRERALWTLPGARTKNKREHEVPLSRQALAIVDVFAKAAAVRGDGAPYLFGLGGRAPFSGWSRSKRRLVHRSGVLDAECYAVRRLGRELRRGEKPNTEDRRHGWTVHDIRRSGVTFMADELAVEPHIAEAIINHVSGHKGGVAGVYNHAAYREQKRIALQRWADWLEAAVAGRKPASNVIALAG